MRRAKTAAAAAPNRISIGGAGTSCPPDDVEVEVDPPEVELDDEVEELLDDEVEDEPDEPEDPDDVDDPEEVDEPEDEPEDPLDEPCPWP